MNLHSLNSKSLWRHWFIALLFAASALLLALHYLHLSADYPHYSPWPDPARLTDEGWYTGAAMRYFLSPSWVLPGDFNPSITLPVFPAIVFLVFHFTGAGIVAARALSVTCFAATLVAAGLLVRRYSTGLAAAAAVFLVACCPLLYAYSRMAIVEPLLTLESLLALLAASCVTPGRSSMRYVLPSACTGLLMAAMVFTKTPGICLFPAIFYLIFARCHYNLRTALKPLLLASAVAAACAAAYYADVVHAGYKADFVDLFAINKDRIHGRIVLSTLRDVARTGTDVGTALLLMATLATILVIVVCRRRTSPLLVASALGVAGYGAFITYHGWLMPRYYVVPMPLVAIAAAVALTQLVHSSLRLLRPIAAVIAAVLLIACIGQIRTILRWTRTPSYSYVQAARAIYRVINRDSSHNRTVLSRNSQELALLGSEHGTFVNELYGTIPLRRRVLLYKPGWLITFDETGPATQDALKGLYSPQLVDTEPAYGDDGIHFHLHLYKLIPVNPQSASGP